LSVDWAGDPGGGSAAEPGPVGGRNPERLEADVPDARVAHPAFAGLGGAAAHVMGHAANGVGHRGLVTARHDGVDEGAAGQTQQLEAEARRGGHMLEIGLVDLTRVIAEQTIESVRHAASLACSRRSLYPAAAFWPKPAPVIEGASSRRFNPA